MVLTRDEQNLIATDTMFPVTVPAQISTALKRKSSRPPEDQRASTRTTSIRVKSISPNRINPHKDRDAYKGRSLLPGLATPPQGTSSGPPKPEIQSPGQGSHRLVPSPNPREPPENKDTPTSVTKARLPGTAEPWDHLRGAERFCVFKNRVRLLDECANSAIESWAPNCATFSRARERPIPGVPNSPKPLRSITKPRGLDHILKLPSHARSRIRVEQDTEMAELSARRCMAKHKADLGFLLEHPGNSIAHHLDAWINLKNEPGVSTVKHHHCMFEGCTHRKFQTVYTNIPELAKALDRICLNPRCCTRTGQLHPTWEHQVEGGAVTKFATRDLAEYPRGYCTVVAEAVIQYLSRVGCSKRYSFIEIFCGKNAPLTTAAEEELSRINGRITRNPSSSQAVAPSDPAGGEAGAQAPMRPAAPLSLKLPTAYQLASKATGMQPKWNPAYQLIPDGINDQYKHLELAKSLSHPGLDEGELPEDLRSSIRAVSDRGLELVHHRLQVIHTLETRCKDLESARVEAFDSAGFTFRTMRSPLHIPLMKFIGEIAKIEDRALPDKLLIGLPIIGPADESPFFEPMIVPAKLTINQLLKEAPARRSRIIERIEQDALRAKSELLQAVFDKTMAEVDENKMGPPMSLEEVLKKYGEHHNIVQRYGIEQGVDEKGHTKFRCIDNHLDNLNNDAAERRQKVPMASVGHIVLMIRAMYLSLKTRPEFMEDDWALTGATEDLKAAYRQCPLLSSQMCVCVTAIWNPEEKRVQFHDMYGQPFGAGHAVPNFCRIAEWAARAARRLLLVVADHFFDDYFIVEPKCTAASAVWSFRRLLNLVGLQIDPKKSQLPSDVWRALGVHFDMQAIRSSGTVFVKPTPKRLHNAVAEILSILIAGRLRSSQAAKVFGKVDFLNTTLFGRVGRSGMLALKIRQYENLSASGWPLTVKLTTSLCWLAEVLATAPPREIRLREEDCDTVLLYTDGSSDPSRTPKHVVGALLYDPRTKATLYTYTPVPESVVQEWLPSGQQVHLVELFAGPLALDTFKSLLSDRYLIHFIDNSAALGALVKGYSPSEDNIKIVGDYWLRAASRKLFIYCDRVESKSNISDDPSRLNIEGVMSSIGATYWPPCLTSLEQPAPNRDPTQWFGGAERVGHLRTALFARLAAASSSSKFFPTNNPPY